MSDTQPLGAYPDAATMAAVECLIDTALASLAEAHREIVALQAKLDATRAERDTWRATAAGMAP